jgi:aminomethyltransferase
MVDFGGYEMPLEYKGMGISETALWTRSKASIFDVGHM